MKLALFNCNGLKGPKPGLILDHARTNGIDILLLVETWQSSHETPLINGHFMKICQPTNDIIQRGGRRARDGILGVAINTNYNDKIRILYQDDGNLYGFFEFDDTIFGI